MKKILAAALAVSTVASIASINVFAATEGEFDVTSNGGVVQLYSDTNNSKTIANGATVNSDTSVYVQLSGIVFDDPDTKVTMTEALSLLMADGDLFKAKFDKGDDNAKIIDKISIVEKIDGGSANGREAWIKVAIKEDMTDKEYKISPVITFTAKKDMTVGFVADTSAAGVIKSGQKFTVSFSQFIKNTDVNTDANTDAGTSGIVIKPVSNEENEVIWEDKNEEIARLTFIGDSDASKFYPKLSTKWDNEEYEQYFKTQNAFQFKFVGNPTISSTSRATLELYNPYMDEDDNELVAVEDITIFLVDANGDYTDVTDTFTYGSNENDDMVFSTKTRTLGTYVMCEMAPEAEEIVDDITAPVEVVEVDKVVPITGNF